MGGPAEGTTRETHYSGGQAMLNFSDSFLCPVVVNIGIDSLTSARVTVVVVASRGLLHVHCSYVVVVVNIGLI